CEDATYRFFATQIAQDVSIDVLLARTADLAGCPVGVAAGLVRRSAEPGGKIIPDLEPPPGAVCRHLPSGETVWVARVPACHRNEAILDELAFAARVALIRHPPSRTRQELLTIACDRGADEHERLSALSALGFTRNALVRCLAIAGPPSGVERLAE